MTHEELIQRLAGQLGWSDVATTEALEAIISVLKAELTANNPVDLDDFGKFSTPKQPEYILTDPETNDRYLMPPAVEILFESSSDLYFTPEDSLSEFVNGAFSFFEPTPLHEGVALPGVTEVIIRGEEETEAEEERATDETAEMEETEVEIEGTAETEKTAVKTEAMAAEAVEAKQEMVETEKETAAVSEEYKTETEETVEQEKVKLVRDNGPYRRKTKHKKKSTLWIPVAGGVAIALVALFFFRRNQNKELKPFIVKNKIENANGNVPSPRVDSILQMAVQAASHTKEEKEIIMEEGKTLRLLALELFGNKEFWVYIYLANSKYISNPNHVTSGTRLLIPDTSEYRIDAFDYQSVAEAKALGERVLNKYSH